MTTSTAHFLHCDAAGCDAQAPYDDYNKLYVKHRPDGWANAIYTHGCPRHGDVILAHAATITSQTRGRGRSEKTTWFLTCACGWRSAQPWQTYNSDYLQKAHLAHVQRETAAVTT